MSGAVDITRDGPLMRVCLNRPEKLNSFSAELVDALHGAVIKAGQGGVRLLVFTGAGKGFSGGFDLSGLEEMSDGDLVLRFVRVEELLQAVYHAPFATMALVHGPCYGAAADLVAACQWRTAAPDARFRMPGLRFGVVLGTRRLVDLVGADAAQALLLRDGPFDAQEALAEGFLQDLAKPGDWAPREQQRLQSILALSPSAVEAMNARTRRDTRDADLAALVRSASTGSIKDRISAYLTEMRERKTSR